MTGRHRKGGPWDRGKGRENSGAARYWIHYTDPESGGPVSEQYFVAMEYEDRLEFLTKRGVKDLNGEVRF